MRIGEIVIISSTEQAERRFIASICEEVEHSSQGITFGRFPVNNQLTLHLYGFSIQEQNGDLSWDFVAAKMLGGIVIFPWDDDASFAGVAPAIDLLTNTYHASLVVAAEVERQQLPVPATVSNAGITLTNQGTFTFFHPRDSHSVKKVLTALINQLIPETN